MAGQRVYMLVDFSRPLVGLLQQVIAQTLSAQRVELTLGFPPALVSLSPLIASHTPFVETGMMLHIEDMKRIRYTLSMTSSFSDLKVIKEVI